MSGASDTSIRMIPHTRVLGVRVHAVSMSQAVEYLVDAASRLRRIYAVTANLDHVVLLSRSDEFRVAYEHASLVVADGMPLVWASRFSAQRLPERVAGADLILPICNLASQRGLSVFLFGTTLESLRRAAIVIKSKHKNIDLVGVYSPLFHEDDDFDDEMAIDAINYSKPDIIFVALGAPKQEIWMYRNIANLDVGCAIGIGAGLDFLAEVRRRAPLWMRKVGLEWVWRMITDRRLVPRYARDAWWLARYIVRYRFTQW